MPGLTVDVDAQLKIDSVVTGSKFSSSLDRVLDDVQKQAESRKIVPFSMKELQKMSSVISKTVLSSTGGEIKIPYSLVLDTMKEKNKAFALAGEIQKAMAIKGIEMSDEGAIKQAMSILDMLKKKRISDTKDIAKLNEETFLAYEKLELREKKKVLDYTQQRNTELLKEMSGDLASGKSEMKGGYTPTKGSPVEVVKSKGWASKFLPPQPVAPGMGATPGKPAASPSGGVMGGLAGPAAVAGAVAAGVSLLVETIQGMTKQSKITSMVTDTFNKAMGLLIDLILIPFIPILAWAIVNLFKIILWVGGIWKSIVAPFIKWVGDLWTNLLKWLGFDDKKNLWQQVIEFLGIDHAMDLADAILIALGLKDPNSKPTKEGAGDTLSSIIGAASLVAIAAALIAGIAAAIIAFGALTYIGGVLAEMLVTALAASLASGALIATITAIGTVLLTAAAVLIIVLITAAIVNYVLSPGSPVIAAGKAFAETLDKWHVELIKWQNALASWWIGIQAEWGKALGNIKDTIMGGLRAIANGAISILNVALSFLRKVPGLNVIVPADIPYLATGGLVEQTGIAVIHKGETVVPAGNTSYQKETISNETNNQLVFNFYGYQDDKFISKVKEILRQQGAGYHL